jgi:hypothetical protein
MSSIARMENVTVKLMTRVPNFVYSSYDGVSRMRLVLNTEVMPSCDKDFIREKFVR